MALTTGVRFGAYEIVAPIGAGGMGEVYRARDRRIALEAGGEQARWHPNATELFYIGGDDALMAVPIQVTRPASKRVSPSAFS